MNHVREPLSYGKIIIKLLHVHLPYSLESFYIQTIWTLGFPSGYDGKESACNVWDLGLIPGLGRSHGEGTSNPLQSSCLESPMDREAWWATVHRVAESQTQLRKRVHRLSAWGRTITSFQSFSVVFSVILIPFCLKCPLTCPALHYHALICFCHLPSFFRETL